MRAGKHRVGVMNPYVMVASGIETVEAAALSGRLSAWHDAMVAHERKLRAGIATCDDACPHAEAPVLWVEAVEAFGPRAQDLVFLRAHGKQRSAMIPRPSRITERSAEM
jgi:hypothetical protein